MANLEIGGILHKTDLTEIDLLSIPQDPCIVATILQALGDKRVSARLIVQCADPGGQAYIALCVAEADSKDALDALEAIRSDLGEGRIVHQNQVAMVSIFGPEFQERPGLAGAMFSALAEAGIEIRAVSTSIATVSCVVDQESVPEALQALHDAFEVSTEWQV